MEKQFIRIVRDDGTVLVRQFSKAWGAGAIEQGLEAIAALYTFQTGVQCTATIAQPSAEVVEMVAAGMQPSIA